MKNKAKVLLPLWERNLDYILKGLFSDCKKCSIGLSFGKLEVTANHKMDNQKWELDGYSTDAHLFTTEQKLELYYRMESHRLGNIDFIESEPQLAANDTL